MTRRPASPFLTAEWRHLALFNYVVDPALLAPWVPRGTALDLWHGRAYLSLVAFRFLQARVKGIAIPLHRNFDEINLRFYVQRPVADGFQRGVVFIKEIVPRLAIASVARWAYNENYVSLPTRHAVLGPPEHQHPCVEYGWLFPDTWNMLRADTRGEPMLPLPNSEADFITDHRWGFVRQRNGTTRIYEVQHPPWRTWAASGVTVLPGASALYGSALARPLARRPDSVFVAEGSAVTVFTGQPLEA